MVSMRSAAEAPVRVFVGTDRSQLLAVRVLEHSIRRHTTLPVEVTPMHDLQLPEPRDPRQGKRTGFSFARFAIPALAGRQGRALYLDADMLVFRDIRALWSIPFEGARVVIQEELPDGLDKGKAGAPAKRVRQTAVMLLDCGRLDWDAERIIAGLDGLYTYEELLQQLCILEPGDIRCAIPFAWNSLETWGPETCLLHYTDMATQPWVSPENRWGHLWLAEVGLMLRSGALGWAEIEAEIAAGHFRPSLRRQLQANAEPEPVTAAEAARLLDIDRAAGFVKHAEVYAAKRRREKAIREFEAAHGTGAPDGPAPAAASAAAHRPRRLLARLASALGRA